MDCFSIPQMSYTQWCRRVYAKADNARVPLNGIMELTYRCNLRCVHCYGTDYPITKELSFQEVCSVIDQITEAGCLFLLLTGGEPLIRKDFVDIYLYAKRKGLLVTVFTNGTLITPEIADLLAAYPPFTVEITLYGITEKTSAEVTGLPGSLERSLRGIELLRKRNVDLKLKAMVVTLNKHELWKIKEYVEDLGISFRFDPYVNPRLSGSKESCKFRITPSEVVELDLADERRTKDWQKLCDTFWGTPASDQRYYCAAGITYFLVTPFGGVKVCPLLAPSYSIISLKKDSFIKGWNTIAPKISHEKRDKESPCSDCDIFSICDNCPGNATLEVGEPDSVVPFLCQVAKLRAAAFDGRKRMEKQDQEGGFFYAKKKEERVSQAGSRKG
ncbi:radical SAM protein [Candidatus Omnitrophota bacterium]